MQKYEKISIKDLSREEWLKLRKTGIGGSDAGAILGVNPYSNKLKIFRDKTCEEVEEMSNEAIRQGVALEEYVAQRFCEETGKKVHKSNFMYRSKSNPFMLADLDRLVVGEDAGLECKTANAYSADQWKAGRIPEHYVSQCYHYMAVTGKKTWFIACLIIGKEFIWHKLEWDDDIIKELISAERDFWNNHIMTGIMPEPDGTEVSDKIINQYYGIATEGSTIELVGFDDKIERRNQIIEEMENLKKEQTLIEQEVKLAMGENEYGLSAKFKASWINVESKRLDTRLIKEDGLYDKYAKTSSTRRFQIKAA